MFPVELSAYNAEWPVLFEAEKLRIAAALGADLIHIEHFDSTSILGITAKDTIDILANINPDENKQDTIVAAMRTIGYDFMWQLDGAPNYRIFTKGFTTDGKK